MAKKITTPIKIAKKAKSPKKLIENHIVTNKDKNIRKRIKTQISLHVKKHGNDFTKWYCGITSQKISTRINQHQKLKEIIAIFPFLEDAKNLSNAHNIEKYFNEKGMKNDKRIGNAKEESTFVYAFMLDGNIFDYLASLIYSD